MLNFVSVKEGLARNTRARRYILWQQIPKADRLGLQISLAQKMHSQLSLMVSGIRHVLQKAQREQNFNKATSRAFNSSVPPLGNLPAILNCTDTAERSVRYTLVPSQAALSQQGPTEAITHPTHRPKLHMLFSKERKQTPRLTLPKDQTSAYWIIHRADAGTTGHMVPHGQQASLAFNQPLASAPFLLRMVWQICLRTQQHVQPLPRHLTSPLQPQRGDFSTGPAHVTDPNALQLLPPPVSTLTSKELLLSSSLLTPTYSSVKPPTWLWICSQCC